jgi:hypothetical protein
MTVPPINLWTYRQAFAVAIWLALSPLAAPRPLPEPKVSESGAAD